MRSSSLSVLAVFIAFSAMIRSTACATMLNFYNLTGSGQGAMSTTVFGIAEIPGATATFSGFSHYGSPFSRRNLFNSDVQGNATYWSGIYSTGNTATITFNDPRSGGQPLFRQRRSSSYQVNPTYMLTITGTLQGATVWTYGPPAYPTVGNPSLQDPSFVQVTNGAGDFVDELTFSDAKDVAFDDILIVPEPSSLGLLSFSSILMLRRRRQRV